MACMAAAMVAGAPANSAHAEAAVSLEQPRDSGYLDVGSDPPGAKILIDDTDTGKTTPQTQMPLKVGHHKLTVVTADGAHSRTIGFTVAAGQTTKLTVHLSS